MGFKFRYPRRARMQLGPLESKPAETEVGRGGTSCQKGNKLKGRQAQSGSITVCSRSGVRKTVPLAYFDFLTFAKMQERFHFPFHSDFRKITAVMQQSTSLYSALGKVWGGRTRVTKNPHTIFTGPGPEDTLTRDCGQ